MDKFDKIGVRLPDGSALTWDMTTLSDIQLEYEYKIAYESLYGAEVAGYPVMKGFLNSEARDFGVNQEDLARAIHKWQQRLKRAEDELFERQLL